MRGYSKQDWLVYLTEQRMRHYGDKDCVLCRGHGCEGCRHSGKLHHICGDVQKARAERVYANDKAWLQEVGHA